MKTLKFLPTLFVVFLALMVNSCSVIEGIFKMGVGVGIFITVAVIVIIVVLLLRIGKGRN